MTDASVQRLLSRVYGDNPDSLFIKEKLGNLIRFPLKSPKMPLTFKAKIDLEPIPELNELAPLKPYKPILFEIGQRKSVLVIGYRELFDKRERVTLLRWQAGLDLNDERREHQPIIRKISAVSFLAPGGGGLQRDLSRKSHHKSKKEPSQSNNGKRRRRQQMFNQRRARKVRSKVSDRDFTSSSGEKKGRNSRKINPGPGVSERRHHSRHYDGVGGVPYSSELSDTLPEHAVKKLERDLQKELGEAKGITLLVVDPTAIEKPLIEQEFLKCPVPEVECEASDLPKLVFRRESSILEERRIEEMIPTERDSEWLYCSSTESEEVRQQEKAEQLLKQREPYMLRGITFESQHIVHSLRWFLLSSWLSGRSIFYTRPDYHENIIVFVVDRGKEFIFLITSTILWLCFVLIVQASIDILLAGGLISDYALKEKTELNQYFIPCFYVIGELAIVAVWSVFLLLNYALRVAHYINVWCAAASEMEANVGKGIVTNTVGNHAFFLFYSFFLTLCFMTDVPKNVRGSMGVLTALLVRNFIPNALDLGDSASLFFVQLFGLCLHIYVMYCARITCNLTHIMCIILKNASELWNLKFALRFDQIPVGRSGYLNHMRIRQTYKKAWQHHRLLTGLCTELGNVLATPVALNFMSRLGVVVWCLVDLFQRAYVTKQKRQQYESLPRFTYRRQSIPTPLEDVSTVVFILVYMIFDFLVNASYLDAAGQAFRDGFEFVRRRGLLLCANSRERRLIQSLQWSFSATRANEVNLKGFFPVNKETILSFLSIALLLWSLIIQLQAEVAGVVVVFTPNCSQKPSGRYNHTRDSQGFCRKKIWTVETEVNARAELITQLNLSISLETKELSRRRRRSVGLSDDRAKLDLTTVVHWRGSKAHHKPGYWGGNCMRPKTTSSGGAAIIVRGYYVDFHETCHSAVLNMTLLVPKLFSRRQRVWIGRRSVDCGIFPFPLPSAYSRDCGGNGIRMEDYDDCGWRSTPVDHALFRHEGGNRGKIRKIPFGSPGTSSNSTSGQIFYCWNILHALKRCQRIQELGLWDMCKIARSRSSLDFPKEAIRNFGDSEDFRTYLQTFGFKESSVQDK